MYKGKSVAVVVPCYDEERQIWRVLETMPPFVDVILVIDDCSTDGTVTTIQRFIAERDPQRRVVLLQHDRNRGVGRAIVTGYQEAIRRRIDVSAVMAGDAQMDPAELHLLVDPIAMDQADYSKGNRLFYPDAWSTIPRHRYLGNAFLSMLTKIASGYWHSADSQTGYTAIALEALELINLEGIYPRYGYPNDMLVRLNVFDMRVIDVPIRPVYSVGERSKIRLWKVMPTMSWLIFRRFIWRLFRKYVIQDFHPLVLFYAFGALSFSGGLLLGLYLLLLRLTTTRVAPTSTILAALLLIAGLQLLLFAMSFDMEINRRLAVVTPRRRKKPSESVAERTPELTHRSP